MSSTIKDLEPRALWNNFAHLNAIPRPSKKEQKVIQFMLDFGHRLNLETIKDPAGNVIIKKPATPGMENKKTVVLQGHLDMVHQKNNDTDFDFATQGINMYVDGDWVRTRGTTLGADNGIGVSAIMAILESKDIPHPAIEALFTFDEETGMTGAKELAENILTGDILLNLDTEQDNEIDIGCAGGVDVTATRNYTEIKLSENSTAYTIKLKGLTGGHSGMDIILGRGNANKLMNRILYGAYQKAALQIASIDGGGLRNAIPRESTAVVAVPNSSENEFHKAIQEISEAIKTEFSTLEKELEIIVEKTASPEKVLSEKDTEILLKTLYAAHNGVYRMSPDIKGLVETSNNIARVKVGGGQILMGCLTRSSVESGKWNLVHALRSVFELGQCKVTTDGDYPGWAPNSDSAILKVLTKVYERQNGEKAEVIACHAGLECGIIGSHYPNMDMISFGPTIIGAHSPDERASISSTQKFWKFLLEVLKEIPEKV